MKAILAVALAGLALSSSPARAADEGKSRALAQELPGAWTLVSDVIDQGGGVKVEPFGPSPKGTVLFTNDGSFSLVITRPDAPKFASGNRTAGTPEENKAAVQGSIAYFGTYTVSEPDRTVNLHLEGSTFPNWNGNDQKRIARIAGDELTWLNPTTSVGAGTATLVWKRVKGRGAAGSAKH